MRIITFYSYKGGHGRTTAIANVGACLYRLGYNVVLLDLDFESPGLPAKFGFSVFRDPTIERHGGVLDYLIESYDRMAPLPTIADRTLEVTAAGGARLRRPGGLRIIPTGYVDSKHSYFRTLGSQAWKYLVDLSDAGRRNIPFVDGLAEAIGNLSPHPDYLLVDLSSGMSEFGQIILLAWPGTLVTFLSNDAEAFDGMRFVVEHLQRLPEQRRRIGHKADEVQILTCLCRVPPFLRPAAESELRRNVSEAVLAGKDYPLFFLHSDQDLEHDTRLRIPPEGPILNVQLTREYLALLSTACPEIARDAPGTDLPDELLRRLDLSASLDHAYRVFAIRQSEGVMINLSDEQRNVSFKVATFCAMLNDIHNDVVRKLQGTTRRLDVPESIPRAEEAFRNAGRVSGADFGTSLMQGVWADAAAMPDERKLREWCEFDSSVGFGRMTATNLTSKGHTVSSGAIDVTQNFLAWSRQADSADLCQLLGGYIEGVLGHILNPAVRVDHPRELCMRHMRQLQACTFLFAIS